MDDSHEASRGVTIGYAIQHPYMFITNSYENANPRDEETGNPDAFNYRNHWHIPYKDHPEISYLSDGTHILFNAWNAKATAPGLQYSSTPKDEEKVQNAKTVTKSVYDPCPPGFKMPPIDALFSINNEKTDLSYQGNKWTMNIGGKSITFPLTGVRNYALRRTEWESVQPLTGVYDVKSFYISFYKTSMPAFKMLTFMSSATIIKKESYNAYQVYIFCLDRNDRSYEPTPDTPNYKMYITASSNSYGLSVRPVTSDSE